jgi:hypothetical protein
MDLLLHRLPKLREIELPEDDTGGVRGESITCRRRTPFGAWGEIWGAANRRLVCAPNGRAPKCSYRNMLAADWSRAAAVADSAPPPYRGGLRGLADARPFRVDTAPQR